MPVMMMVIVVIIIVLIIAGLPQRCGDCAARKTKGGSDKNDEDDND